MLEKGIIRKIDEFGRLVIPIEIRNRLNIQHEDEIEFFTEKNSIVIKKYEK